MITDMKFGRVEKKDLRMAILEATESVEALIVAHKKPHSPGYIDEPLVKDRRAQVYRWQKLYEKLGRNRCEK